MRASAACIAALLLVSAPARAADLSVNDYLLRLEYIQVALQQGQLAPAKTAAESLLKTSIAFGGEHIRPDG